MDNDDALSKLLLGGSKPAAEEPPVDLSILLGVPSVKKEPEPQFELEQEVTIPIEEQEDSKQYDLGQVEEEEAVPHIRIESPTLKRRAEHVAQDIDDDPPISVEQEQEEPVAQDSAPKVVKRGARRSKVQSRTSKARCTCEGRNECDECLAGL